MKILTILIIGLIVVGIIYYYKNTKNKLEHFDNTECNDVDDEGNCKSNKSCKVDSEGNCIPEKDCEVDSEGNCIPDKECKDVDDEGNCIPDKGCEDVDDEGNCIIKKPSDESYFKEENKSSLEIDAINAIKTEGLDGEIKNNIDPISVGTTVKGVIEKVPRERVREYIKLFQEPDAIDTVQYENTRCLLEIPENKRNSDTCYNNDITKNFKTGKCLPRPNMLQCDADYQDANTDPADFYRKINRAIIAPMNDSVLKGYNYDIYSNYLKPQQLHQKLFDKSEFNIPRGFTYAFMNTPSYE